MDRGHYQSWTGSDHKSTGPEPSDNCNALIKFSRKRLSQQERTIYSLRDCGYRCRRNISVLPVSPRWSACRHRGLRARPGVQEDRLWAIMV
ncbi:hypothetical protein RRG08_009725 [Elysia crispata]|uniref:Uncharacterized protein n=1 Tax=Elysia crispata TaxID=231223 RepID=A0AAE0Y7W8_9GAST|nr:hypothetical protein RRG08_009725 [Elysia crispata]